MQNAAARKSGGVCFWGILKDVAGTGGGGGFRVPEAGAFGAIQGLFGRLAHGRDLGFVLFDKASLVLEEGARGGVIAFADRLLCGLPGRNLLGGGFHAFLGLF